LAKKTDFTANSNAVATLITPLAETPLLPISHSSNCTTNCNKILQQKNRTKSDFTSVAEMMNFLREYRTIEANNFLAPKQTKPSALSHLTSRQHHYRRPSGKTPIKKTSFASIAKRALFHLIAGKFKLVLGRYQAGV
jgi:hypothetical protein